MNRCLSRLAPLVIHLLFAMPAGAGLTVVDAAGNPVAGAEVEARTAPVAEGLLARLAAPSDRAESGSDGSVDLRLPAVPLLLVVDHPDHAPWAAEIAPDARPDRVVLEPGRLVQGVVASKDRGSASAPREGTVCATWRETWDAWDLEAVRERCAELGEGGSFGLRGLPGPERQGETGDSVELIVRVPGFLPSRRDLTGVEPGTPVHFELVRGVLLLGRVEDGSGGAVAGVRVREETGSRALSAADGRFEIAVKSLPATLVATAAGYRPTRSRVVTSPSAERRLTITLAPAERLTGWILGEDGEIPAGAALVWEVEAEGRRASGRYVLASDDGAFALDLPGPGRYLLGARAEGFENEELPELFVGAAESIDLGVVELSRGAGVRGRVIEAASGDGLAGVSVVLLPAGIDLFRSIDGGIASAVTGDDGFFDLSGIEGGAYELRARRDGYATHRSPVTVRRDEGATLDPISLDAGTVIELRLVDRAGDPRAGLALRVFDPGHEILLPIAEGVSDSEGVVGPLALAAGRHRLEVTGERLLLAQELEVPVGEDALELELTVGGVDLSGSVTRRGEPVVGGTLSLTSALDPGNARGKLFLRTPDGRSAAYGLPETEISVEVAVDGNFRVPDAPAGLLHATWISPDGEAVHREVLVPDRARAVVTLDVGGVALAGRVVSGDGAPLEGALLRVTDATGRGAGEARSGADGEFAVADLVPGEYRLEATAEEYASVALAVRVGEREPSVEVTMEAGGGGAVEVVLERDDGSPLAGTLVSLLEPSGRVVRSLAADGRGRRGFDSLPAGDYIAVWSDAVAGVGHSPTLRVREGGPAEPAGAPGATSWRAALPTGGELSIVCTRPECSGAAVDLLTLHSAAGLPLAPFLPGVSGGLRFSADGELRLGRLAPGSYRLALWAAGSRWEVPVSAGSDLPTRVVIGPVD